MRDDIECSSSDGNDERRPMMRDVPWRVNPSRPCDTQSRLTTTGIAARDLTDA
jgi:hypothetical protein